MPWLKVRQLHMANAQPVGQFERNVDQDVALADFVVALAERAVAESLPRPAPTLIPPAGAVRNEALTWFGAEGFEGKSVWAKGGLLAEQVPKQRTL